jgi:hypothetical protein
MPAAQGSTPGVAPYITSEKFFAADAPVTLNLPQNAHTHQVAINAIDGAAGTAAITIRPVGMIDFIPLLESDGATPVVLDMINGDARSDIRGSLQAITATLSGFDGTKFKLSVTSFF